MSASQPDLSADTNPFLRSIRDETHRLAGLEVPRGYCVSSGHLGDVLGAPVHTPAGQDRLLEFAASSGLEVDHDLSDGLIFTVKPAPPAPGEAK